MSKETTHNLPNDHLRLILVRLDSIDSSLTTLEDKIDRRLLETRPIWEQVLTRLDGLDTRLDNLEHGMQDGFRRLERRMALLATA